LTIHSGGGEREKIAPLSSVPCEQAQGLGEVVPKKVNLGIQYLALARLTPYTRDAVRLDSERVAAKTCWREAAF
jgi:hypothetical protein